MVEDGREASSRLLIFPDEWKEGMIYPLFKRGDKRRPENYRPLCLLSHARKVIESAVLTKVNFSFTPTRAQFSFQPGISLQQEMLTEDGNARRGLSHMAVLDLEKAYDRVDRRKLLFLHPNGSLGTYLTL